MTVIMRFGSLRGKRNFSMKISFEVKPKKQSEISHMRSGKEYSRSCQVSNTIRVLLRAIQSYQKVLCRKGDLIKFIFLKDSITEELREKKHQMRSLLKSFK